MSCCFVAGLSCDLFLKWKLFLGCSKLSEASALCLSYPSGESPTRNMCPCLLLLPVIFQHSCQIAQLGVVCHAPMSHVTVWRAGISWCWFIAWEGLFSLLPREAVWGEHGHCFCVCGYPGWGKMGLWYASLWDILNVYQLLTSVVSPLAEFGDLSSSVRGFVFTVTNKLPNKSLPDLKKIKIIKKRKEKKRKKKEKRKTPQNCKSPRGRGRGL